MAKSKTKPPESIDLSDDRLDVGLAAAFGSDAAFSGGTTGDFLVSPESPLHAPPRVRLRHASEDDPVVESYDVPSNLESTGRYELRGEIGHGGMGTIYWARDTALGCELAIKVLAEKYRHMPQARERFVEEAQIAGQLQHPGIVPVHELGEFDDGRPYMTMKLVKGQTLARLLAAREFPSQDRPRFLGIFEQVCQTLAYTHSRSVIHRDLKPANIMVGAFAEVQVMDWGLAKVLTEADFELASQSQSDQGEAGETRSPDTTDAETVAETDRSTRLATHAGTIMGTPAYISPEQIRGDVDRTDEQSDVFGLGAILCEILSGLPPYVGENATEVEQRAKNVDLADAFHRLDQCGADGTLILLTKRCLDPAPANRPRHAGVLAEELAEYLESVQERLRQTELENVEVRAKATHERKLRWMTVTLAAMVVLFGGLAAGGWFWVQQDRQNQIAETNRRLQAELKKANETKVQDVLGFYSGLDMSSAQILPNLEKMVGTLFGDSPFDEAMLRQTMSSAYLSMGDHDLARENAEKAVELLTTAAGPDRPATLAAKEHLRRVQESPSNRAPRGRAPPSVNSDVEENVLFSSSYEKAVLADSPVGYWRLNEAAGEQFARDASDNGNDLRYNGTSVTEHGASTFQSEGLGTTDFAQNPIFNFPTSTVSLEFWLKTTATNNAAMISYATSEVVITHEDPNGLLLFIAGRGEHTGVKINDGKWHHVVVTWQSSDGAFELYKDGSLAFRGYHRQGNSIVNNGLLVFGQDQRSRGGGFVSGWSYPGLLAEAAIYDDILSADRVAAHYLSASKLSDGQPLTIAVSDDDPDTRSDRIIQSIEAGDATQNSDYRTIGRPTADDYADLSAQSVTLDRVGSLHPASGPLDVLRDGSCQPHRASSDDSLFFSDYLTSGFLMMDLGREVSVTKINTYTWGADDRSEDPRQHHPRAVQRYTLYGSNLQTPPSTDGPFWARAPWTMITHVNTDAYFSAQSKTASSNGSGNQRPQQQAVSVTSRDGVIAKVRYLLWKLEPTDGRFPFLGEIDVYVVPRVPVPPGKSKIIQTVEAGQGVRDADYTTIGRPSGEDYADLSTDSVTLAAIGTLYDSSGAADVLRDGSGQTHKDSSNESVFFTDETANGCLLMDLGCEGPVTKINTYTWHANEDGFDTHGRAAQEYVLYGSNAATTPSTDGEFWTNPEWTEITRVNTDSDFSVAGNSSARPGQQAVSITSRDGIVADVRYLLWRITPSHRQPFLGEIDVYLGPDSLDLK